MGILLKRGLPFFDLSTILSARQSALWCCGIPGEGETKCPTMMNSPTILPPFARY